MIIDINCTIEGVSPLLCNRFTDEAMESATSGNKLSTVGNKGTPREQAEGKLYVSEDGTLMIPQPNIFRSIIDGGKFFKAGRSKVTTQKSSLIPACLSINEIEVKIIHKDPWSVDTRAVRIPSTGGRIAAHRPCFNDWRLDFTMELDDEVIDVKLLREIVEAAGKRIGLGDFRPDCKGPFGKYAITYWEAQEAKKAA